MTRLDLGHPRTALISEGHFRRAASTRVTIDDPRPKVPTRLGHLLRSLRRSSGLFRFSACWRADLDLGGPSGFVVV